MSSLSKLIREILEYHPLLTPKDGQFLIIQWDDFRSTVRELTEWAESDGVELSLDNISKYFASWAGDCLALVDEEDRSERSHVSDDELLPTQQASEGKGKASINMAEDNVAEQEEAVQASDNQPFVLSTQELDALASYMVRRFENHGEPASEREMKALAIYFRHLFA